MLNIIAAIGRRGELGRDGDMIWYISDDLKRFKRLTTGHPVIMGRRTWESLPNGPLPNRPNIVITSNTHYQTPGAEVVPTLRDAVIKAAEMDDEIFIIGGGSVYAQAINAADRLYLTQIEGEAEDADTFFPPVDPAGWEIEEISDEARSRDGVSYRFITLKRKDR